MRRVVVTGIGIVSPCGVGKEVFWERLESGRSLSRFDEEMASMGIKSKVLCRLDSFDVDRYCEPEEFPNLHREDRFIQFGVVAGKQALEDAGLANGGFPAEETGIILASAIGGTSTVTNVFEQLSNRGQNPIAYQPVGPKFYNAGMFNYPATLLARRYGMGGPVTSLSTGCTAGLDALGLSFEIIQRGEARVMLAGASEAPLVPLMYALLDIIGALSIVDCEPEKASRPFDAKRAGFVISEGTAVVVLEDEEHALARGAHIYGEIVGFYSENNAYHMTDLRQEGEEMARVIQRVMSLLDSKEIDYINAHGSSTPQNDVFETNAFKKVFGPQAYHIPISSTKSIVGHTLSSGAMMGVVTALGAVLRSVIPPTANYEERDPKCDLDYVPNVARQQAVNTALVTASGFGGIHSAVVFRKYGDAHER
jgi:minimal PKS ketosynthase (KS/KS alpha)